MSVYEKNMECIRQYYPDMYEAIQNTQPDNTNNKVCIDKSLNNETIVSIVSETRRIFMNSRYNDEEMAENWIRQVGDIMYQEVVIMFGLSNFRCAKRIKDKLGESNLMLMYEPDEEIFLSIIHEIDICDIIRNGNIVLCVKDLNDKYLEIFAEASITYERNEKIRWFIMWNYEKNYDDELQKVIDKIHQKVEMNLIQKNTVLHFSKELIRNKIVNSRDFACQYAFNQLIKEIKEKEISEQIPAIIVSAGPSLDKNVDMLKKAIGKAFIVAVDTSVKTLLNHKIIPDIVVTVDFKKDIILFMHSQFPDIPLLVCDQSNPDVFKVSKGKRFYFRTADSYIGEIYKEYRGEELDVTETGGSVANDAFSMAIMLGFRKIILVGQDLAYTGMKKHASDAYGKGEELDSNRKYYEVEDINGGKVLTECNMDNYRKWFEDKILLYDFIDVIDATEGGAKINGTRITPLSEAIQEWCEKEFDFKEIINNIHTCFNEEEQNNILKKIDNIGEELNGYVRDIENGLRYYDRLYELSRKNKAHTKEYRDIVRKIGDLSTVIESNSLLGIASIYSKKEEYEVMDVVYNKKEKMDEDIKDIVENGTKMLKLYMKSIREFQNDLKETEEEQKNKLKETAVFLMNNIDEINSCIYGDRSDEIDRLLKSFYNNYVHLVDILDDNTDREESIRTLYEIVKVYEEKKYYKVAELCRSAIIEKMIEDTGCEL